MAFRSTAHARLALTGLAMAGAVAGSSGTAFAQYYEYDYGYEAYAPRYYERYAPVPPAQIPPRAIGRVAARDYGLSQIDRTVRTESSYIIDGRSAQGRRTRLIIDRYTGDLVDRIALPETRREAPRVARIDPRADERPAPRLDPRPPERPASLKPPAEASAPATQPLPSPATLPRAAEPVGPTEPPAAATANAPATDAHASPASPPRVEPAPATQAQPPATANAPATVAPAAPAAPPAPTPGTADPATGASKPQLVNPSDVRGTSGPEREPPLARAEQPAPAGEAIKLPPVQIDDASPAKPGAETPIAPVAPLD